MAKVKKSETSEAVAYLPPPPPKPPTQAQTVADDDDSDDENGNTPFKRIRKFLIERYDFRNNIIQNEIEYRKKVGGGWEPVNESDIEYRLFERGFKSIKNYLNAILKSQFTAPQYNPVKEYFENLKPYNVDKEGDVIQKLSEYIETDNKPFWELHFKKSIVRTIACALRIEKFNKQAVIFQGKQNDGKTSFVRFLVPPQLGSLYIANSFDPRQKDHERRLATCLIVNLDEMADLSRQDANLIKSKMTLESIKMRPPYGTKGMEFPRIASFFGSTNDDQFLNDPTGSSRWVIIKVLSVKHDKGGKDGYSQNIDIDRVWAQALHLLNEGFEYKLTDKELNASQESNKDYQIATIEMEYLSKYFEPSEPDEVMFKSEIIDYILAQHPKAILKAYEVGKALKHFKYDQGSRYAADAGHSLKGFKVRKKAIELNPQPQRIEPPRGKGEDDLPF